MIQVSAPPPPGLTLVLILARVRTPCVAPTRWRACTRFLRSETRWHVRSVYLQSVLCRPSQSLPPRPSAVRVISGATWGRASALFHAVPEGGVGSEAQRLLRAPSACSRAEPRDGGRLVPRSRRSRRRPRNAHPSRTGARPRRGYVPTCRARPADARHLRRASLSEGGVGGTSLSHHSSAAPALAAVCSRLSCNAGDSSSGPCPRSSSGQEERNLSPRGRLACRDLTDGPSSAQLLGSRGPRLVPPCRQWVGLGGGVLMCCHSGMPATGRKRGSHPAVDQDYSACHGNKDRFRGCVCYREEVMCRWTSYTK